MLTENIAIAVPGLLVLAGICIYAALTHLAASTHQRPFDRSRLLFAGTCFTAALFGLSNAWLYQADTVAEYGSGLKLNVALGLPLYGFLLWFTAAYTGVRSQLYLVGMTVLIGFLFGNYSAQKNEKKT